MVTEIWRVCGTRKNSRDRRASMRSGSSKERVGLQASCAKVPGGCASGARQAVHRSYLVEPARRASLDQGLSHACQFKLVVKLRTAH